VLVDPNKPTVVTPQSVLYKCGWSPFDGHTFGASIAATWVNGALAWDGQKVLAPKGQRLLFA
jgi:dihydroorotase